MAQDPTVRSKLCLLSLDGGGVRGLSSLIILRGIMERVNQGRSDAARLRPCQIMDIIGGTSTGGLIAIMLGRLGMDVDECIEKYTSMFANVFGEMAHHVPVGWSGSFNSMFKSDALRTAITKVVTDCGLPADAKLNDGQHRDCHTFVCATSVESAHVIRLRDYDLPGKPKDSLKISIVDAALATSAASSFFDRVRVGDRFFRDGATGSNNPIDDVWIEAENVWNSDDDAVINDMLGCLLSIGTGNPGMRPLHEKSWKFLSETLVQIATDTEQKAEKFEHVHRGLLKMTDKRYYRFNVEQGLQDVGLEEYKLKGQIETATEEYLAKRTQENEIRACAQILKAKESGELPLPSKPRSVVLSEQEYNCLQCLYTSDYRQHKERNPKRVPGTCEWIFKHTKYIDWTSAECSSLLWISADAGCGKSVLASFLVDRLRATVSNTDTTICYFFFKDDNIEQKNTPSAFRSILHQVLTEDLTLVKHAMSQFQLKGRKYADEFTSLWDILVAITADDLHGRNVVCVLDGLDECEKIDRIQMIQYLESFYSSLMQSPSVSRFMLKFLITSRPGVLVEDTFLDLPTIRLKAEDETVAISQDIKLVVQDTISLIGKRRKIPSDQQLELINQIVGNADRTFLWVTFVLQRILSSERFSKAAIKELVETIPPDLDGIYNKILSQTSRSQYTRKVLEIIVGAFRPLSLGELNIAFVIEPRNKSEKDLDLEPDIESTVKSLCGTFLRVVDSTVYLAHQTAREFLLKPDDLSTNNNQDRAAIGPWKHSFHSKNTNQTWAQICRWHLMFTIFDENPLYIAPETGDNFLKAKVEDYTNQYSLLSYTARFWPDHFRNWGAPHEDSSLDAFLSLYEPNSKRFRTWYQIYWNAVYTWSLGPTQNTPLLVAAYFGHVEVVKKLVSKQGTLQRFKSLVIKKEDDPINAKDEDGMSALIWAAANGHLDMVRHLLQQRNIDVNSRSSLKQTPLIYAARHGHFEVAKLLLSRSDIMADARGDRSETALIHAALQGQTRIAQLLIDRKEVDINAKDRFGETPLYNAALSGSLGIFHALLERSDIAPDLSDSRTSVLSAAALGGNEEIFQSVIDFAKRSPHGLNLKGALLDAAKNGNTQILQRLLALDESLLNARSDEAQTPLCLAAMWGRIDATRILLDQPGIDINPIDKYKCTPITWAINWAGGTPEIVDMLLARHGIDLGNQDSHGDTPICSAARAGQTEIARSLVKRSDVDVNHPGDAMFTPLIWAASRGHASIVEILLTREDLELNARETRGMTALAWAAYEGQLDVIRLLVGKSANFNLTDNQGLTPVAHAISRQHEQATKFLLEVSIRSSLTRLAPNQRVLYLQQIPSALKSLIDLEALEAFSA